MRVEYKEEEIIYDEDDNTWRWRSKPYAGLKNAKQAVDRLIAAENGKEKQKPQSAMLKGFWSSRSYTKVTVTSAADNTNKEYWIKNTKGERSKEFASQLFQDTPANHNNIARIEEINKQIRNLNDEILKIQGELEPFHFTGGNE